jgi:hypothetical protein
VIGFCESTLPTDESAAMMLPSAPPTSATGSGSSGVAQGNGRAAFYGAFAPTASAALGDAGWACGDFGWDIGLEAKTHGQLSDPRIHSSAAYDTERRGRVVRVWICKLRMVQGIEKLPSKFKRASFMRPRKSYCL